MTLFKLTILLSIILAGVICQSNIIRGIVDLSPRITPQVTFHVNVKIDFRVQSHIYDANGKVSFVASPANNDTAHFVKVEEDQNPTGTKLFEVVSLVLSQLDLI